jgi:hypothetical protein
MGKTGWRVGKLEALKKDLSNIVFKGAPRKFLKDSIPAFAGMTKLLQKASLSVFISVHVRFTIFQV